MGERLKGWLVIGLLLGTMVYAIAEDITLTTYYPSPRGVYQELKTAGDMVVGDITNPPAARLHVVGSGAAPALRIDDALNDTSPVLVDAAGNVGIGTANPGSKLTVTGTIESSAGGVKFPDSTVQTTASPWAASGADIYNTNTGNVGIGTASPGTYDGQQAQLDVAGAAAADDVWLKAASQWASQVGIGNWGGQYEVYGVTCFVGNPLLGGDGTTFPPAAQCACPAGFNDTVTYRGWVGNSLGNELHSCWKPL